jgi:hypothetical protein
MKTQSLQTRLRKIEDAKNKIVDREKKIRLALSIREKEDNKKLCWLIGHLMIIHRTDASIHAALVDILPMIKPPLGPTLADLLQP